MAPQGIKKLDLTYQGSTATLEIGADLSVGIRGEARFEGCSYGTRSIGWDDVSLDVATIQNNQLSVLGQSVGGLPQTYPTPDGTATVTANVSSFQAPQIPLGQSAVSSGQKELISANVNVAVRNEVRADWRPFGRLRGGVPRALPPRAH